MSVRTQAALDDLHDAALRVAQALASNQANVDTARRSRLDPITSRRLEDYQAAAARFEAAAAEDRVFTVDDIPSDPALDTEPECCS